MERDRRLTGSMYGQRNETYAPKGFELTSAWRVCFHNPLLRGVLTRIAAARKEVRIIGPRGCGPVYILDWMDGEAEAPLAIFTSYATITSDHTLLVLQSFNFCDT